MGLIRSMVRKSSYADAWNRGESVGLGVSTAAGMTVGPDTALRVSAVYACIRLIAESIATLPLHVFERVGKDKQLASDHPLSYLVHDSPEKRYTSCVWRETQQSHVLLGGNGYARIERSRGQVSAIYPLNPNYVTPRTESKTVVYDIQERGTLEAGVSASDILHIPGMGWDGLVGYSPIYLAREAIGLALATQEYGSRLFSNGSRPSGVIKMAGHLKDDNARTRLRQSWEEIHRGSSNSGRVAILEDGAEFAPIAIPPEDAQFLETRKFQVAEIARIFRVPPHMIGDVERTTSWGSGIEQQSIGFFRDTLRPWVVRWEQELNRKLFSERERGRYFCEFNVDGMQRGDLKSRYEAYSIARQWGWMSVNDIRRLENMNAVEDGDEYLSPLNMVPAGERPAPQPATEEVPA